MISLAQVAPLMAAYATAILTVPKLPQQILAIPVAPHWPLLFGGPTAPPSRPRSVSFGLIAVRSSGIYLLMRRPPWVSASSLRQANTTSGGRGIPEVISPIGYTSQNPALFYYICPRRGRPHLGKRPHRAGALRVSPPGIRDNRACAPWATRGPSHRAFGIAGFIAGVGAS
jgi:hypothetical protein